MSLSRRKFMKAGVVAAACAALPLKSVLGQNVQEGRGGELVGNPQSLSAKLSPGQLDYYTQSSFSPYVNTQFRVYLDTSSTRGLKLVEVGDCLARLPKSEASVNSYNTECFSLLFTIPRGRSFDQDTYLMEHEALGTFYMFMVPVSERGKAALDYYQAIIYRSPQQPKGYETASSKSTSTGAVIALPGATTAGLQSSKTEQDVFYFRPQLVKPSDIPIQAIDPGAAGRRAAARLTLSQAPGIGGLRLGMTIDQVLALFPGIRSDEDVRSSLARPASRFGVQSLVVKPGKYPATGRFDQVSQIIFTFLDGRISTLNVGYNGPVWGHVDEFVTKFSGETGLPGADSWETRIGMDTQLKTLRCRDFDISVFAGGGNVSFNYVRLRDLVAQQKLSERVSRAKKGA